MIPGYLAYESFANPTVAFHLWPSKHSWSSHNAKYTVIFRCVSSSIVQNSKASDSKQRFTSVKLKNVLHSSTIKWHGVNIQLQKRVVEELQKQLDQSKTRTQEDRH